MLCESRKKTRSFAFIKLSSFNYHSIKLCNSNLNSGFFCAAPVRPTLNRRKNYAISFMHFGEKCFFIHNPIELSFWSLEIFIFMGCINIEHSADKGLSECCFFHYLHKAHSSERFDCEKLLFPFDSFFFSPVRSHHSRREVFVCKSMEKKNASQFFI